MVLINWPTIYTGIQFLTFWHINENPLVICCFLLHIHSFYSSNEVCLPQNFGSCCPDEMAAKILFVLYMILCLGAWHNQQFCGRWCPCIWISPPPRALHGVTTLAIHQSSSSTQFSQEWVCRKVVIKHSNPNWIYICQICIISIYFMRYSCWMPYCFHVLDMSIVQ